MSGKNYIKIDPDLADLKLTRDGGREAILPQEINFVKKTIEDLAKGEIKSNFQYSPGQKETPEERKRYFIEKINGALFYMEKQKLDIKKILKQKKPQKYSEDERDYFYNEIKDRYAHLLEKEEELRETLKYIEETHEKELIISDRRMAIENIDSFKQYTKSILDLIISFAVDINE